VTSPQDLVDQAVSASTAADCIAIATVTHSTNLRWANNTLTTNGVTRSTDLSVISIVRDDAVRAASLTRTGATTAELAELVAASEAAAAAGPASDDAAPLVPGSAAADWDESPAETSGDVLAPVATGLAASFDQAKSRDEGRYGYAEFAVTTTYLATSTGLRLRHAQSDGRLELTARSRDGSRSAWAGSNAADPARLDVARLEQDVVRRLDWSARRIDLDAGRYQTILPPSAVADLMVYAYWEMGALDAHEGRSVYSATGGGTRVGDSLTDTPLTLRSDPHQRGIECTPFVSTSASSRLSSVFDNGLPLAPTNWIEEGRLTALLQTRHSADVTGLAPTPFVDNLELTGAPGATATADDLVADTDDGLLLTCLWYIREVDPQTLLLTGLTRDGVFRVQNGEVVGAVTNFRFNESPIGMLRRVNAVGRTEDAAAREMGDYFSRTRMPALRVDAFNMSSVSRAS
jgi:predicted Zn-dependent protease